MNEVISVQLEQQSLGLESLDFSQIALTDPKQCHSQVSLTDVTVVH